MSEQAKFFILLIERYSDWKNLSTKAVYEKWKESGHLKDIYDRYWIYHQEALENAFHDIDHLMETGSFLY
ncbi:DUF3791 domain-containing protein [uncultured Dubosiella sp.]|uniref:DUF3791 domain-containing protein n=1 Tax=uncultured Dubosiella sp. TaxID=1937011 RepID=UPI0025E729C3|nr:DUF3791 domain-containing protein [uncultured Dubosiella sp.]